MTSISNPEPVQINPLYW